MEETETTLTDIRIEPATNGYVVSIRFTASEDGERQWGEETHVADSLQHALALIDDRIDTTPLTEDN